MSYLISLGSWGRLILEHVLSMHKAKGSIPSTGEKNSLNFNFLPHKIVIITPTSWGHMNEINPTKPLPVSGIFNKCLLFSSAIMSYGKEFEFSNPNEVCLQSHMRDDTLGLPSCGSCGKYTAGPLVYTKEGHAARVSSNN